MCEFNLRVQTSSHRTLPMYGKNGLNDINAPNKHIKGVRRLYYINNSPYHGYCT